MKALTILLVLTSGFEQLWSRYMVGTRGNGENHYVTNPLGFRCVLSPCATNPPGNK